MRARWLLGLGVMTVLVTVLACDDSEVASEHDDVHGDEGDASTEDAAQHEPGGDALAQRLYVAREGSLAAFSAATGEELPGTLTDIESPVDLQALADGHLLVNLTTRNEVLAFDGRTMLETERFASSGAKGARPVHSFLAPERDGTAYWVTLNDGEEGMPETNSAIFVDVTEGSDARFERVGEVALGVGHHKASFSSTRARAVISNIGDCDDVLTVIDYSDIEHIERVATYSADQAGWTAEDPGMDGFDPRFCDQTYARGLPPAPHGCATSPLSGKAYCNLTGSGETVVIDLDAPTPTFENVATAGSGGGFTFVHPDGRYVYTLQESPREGAEGGGEPCQIGQLAVLDAMDDTLVAELPLFYRGPDCTDELAGTPAESANAGHAYFARGGDVLLVPTSGGFMVDDARVDQVLVVDTSDPAAPEQLASIQVGKHTGHSAAALSGDGAAMFVVHSVDGTVSKIDTTTLKVVDTFDVGDNPVVVATFGSSEGPGKQTGPLH